MNWAQSRKSVNKFQCSLQLVVVVVVCYYKAVAIVLQRSKYMSSLYSVEGKKNKRRGAVL
jgi:hypothetical protein